ncbi:hypothetical protein V6N13_103208 [Hibiscus sabdariffa]
MAVPEVKDGKQEVTTLFVENIPATLHWKGLWFAFARHGDVVNVYIARKLSRGGKRFGFVRMKERIDAVKAIERLQGFVLYGSRLTVKLANAQGGSRLTSVNLSNIDDFRREARRVRINKEDETEKVTGDQNLSEESKHKRLSGHVENEDLWGLRRCLVEETTTVCSLSYIHNRLIEWGVREIKIQRMGAKLFLLTIADEDLFLLLEDLNWSYLKEIFSKVTLWSEKMNYLERATWLEVRGIPILGWNYTNLKKIAELWGTFEFLGENANHTLDCERVTVLISTKQVKRIEEEIEMEIGGEIFVLSISELGFKDDSVLTLEKRVKKGREDRDIPEDSDSVSDAISSEKGVVVEDRCNSGTEVDVINAMCTERDYDDCFLRENNACGSRGIEEEWMGGNSKDTTAGRGIQSVEEFKDNREESVSLDD